jgi:hypothetical protein
MNCLRNARVAYLTFGLAFVVGCHAKPSGNARESSPSASLQQSSPSANISQTAPLTPVAREVERRGYHAKESLIVSPSPWEISTFRLRSKRVFSFRANRPDRGTTNYFCRFTLFEETYDSAEDASHRLANVHLPNPEIPEMELDYLSTMRTGFRVGNVAYVLQTDASSFWDEVQRFAKELAKATPGAELTRVIINAPPNKSLDRSHGKRVSHQA